NEYKALLFEAQGNSRDYAILMTFLKSGIRESELAALNLEDVDFLHNVSVNSFLDTFGPKIRLPQLRHTVAPVSPGQGLYSHAAQSARSHCIDAETRAAPGGGLPPSQRL